MNHFEWLARFRVLLMATFRKPAEALPKEHPGCLAA